MKFEDDIKLGSIINTEKVLNVIQKGMGHLQHSIATNHKNF